MSKKLPYGQSDFVKIRGKNYVYVDKTRYIELLENENNTYQFLLRPRRFGKSLFLSVLEHYYNLNAKDQFEALFGGLYIGQNPTAERNTYAVMRFDFSGIDTDGHDVFRDSFSSCVRICVKNFLEKYANLFPNAEQDIKYIMTGVPGTDALHLACTAAERAGVPIFVIIDEYDHFANNLIAMGKTYTDEVKAGGTVRTFYETLKKGTSSIIKRIFITGVSPMMLNDLTSGFNIATDYTLFPKYNEMFGFTRDDVELIMTEAGINRDLIKVDLEAYYNGYMFSKRGKNKIYNSQMILYLFNMIMQLNEQPEQIVDANLKTDYGRLRRLAEGEGNRQKLLHIILNGKVTASIKEKFSVSDLQNEDYFVSLLFYLGMLTIEPDEEQMYLKIPNYSIKTLYWEYMAEYLKDTEEGVIDSWRLDETVRNLACDGDMMPFMNYFSESFLKRMSNRDLQKFDEKYIKAMMLTLLFTSPLYLPVSEDETINGYTDIYLQKHPAKRVVKYEYVFEIKYAKTDAPAAEVAAKFAEAGAQIEKYRKDQRFAGRDDIKFAALVFKGKGELEVRL